MKLINSKNFISVVCVVYTAISLGKLSFEAAFGYSDMNYQLNFISILVISVLAALVLGLHYYLQNIPLPIVIAGQYLVLLGIALASVWVNSIFGAISPNAYLDMFLSFSIPYIVGAGIYYYIFLQQIKKANQMISKLNSSIER